MYKYEHGGAVRFEHPSVLDFSANINPLGLPHGVCQAITNAVHDCTVYPDSFSLLLRQSIAEYESISSEHILCSNGASDLIFRLCATLKPKKALILAPTFSDYERALVAVQCEVSRHFLYEENGFQLNDDILSSIKSEQFDLVYICNPNNPTGCITTRETMHKLIDLCHTNHCFVAIDECFMDFVMGSEQFTVRPLISKYKNIMVIKAFTKIFALAGVRLGYGLCSDTQLLNKLYAHSPDWSVSTLAQAAGIAALHNPKGYLKETIRFVESEKNKLKSALEQLGITVFQSKANYIFFKSPYLFNIGNELLDKHKIYIRPCGNYHGLNEQFYRIGILGTEHNNSLIDALKKITYYGGNNG